jgi:hypothetical protein
VADADDCPSCDGKGYVQDALGFKCECETCHGDGMAQVRAGADDDAPEQPALVLRDESGVPPDQSRPKAG